MQRKAFVITAALVAGLALAVVFGSGVRNSIASAQTSPSTQTQSSSLGDTLRDLFLDKLAAALNIERSELDSAIMSAGTSTVDEAVQQGTLTQAQADALKARIQAGDFGFFGGGHGGKFGGPRLHGVRQAMLEAAANTLNITTDELVTQLRDGQTLAQVAEAHGTTEQAVTNAALAAAKTQLDQAVADGRLTQGQADNIYAQLQAQGSQLFFHGRRWHRHHRWPGAPMPPEAPSASPDAASDA